MPKVLKHNVGVLNTVSQMVLHCLSVHHEWKIEIKDS